MAEARRERAWPSAVAILPSIVPRPRRRASLRYIDEHVPGIAVPAATDRALRARRRPRGTSASRSPASSPTHARRCPACAGLHLISFRQRGGHRTAVRAPRHPHPRREGVEWRPSSSRRSKTVVIGPEQPFCVIGERINPTGRKAFQAQLQAGDLSQLEIDVAAAGRRRRRHARRQRRRPARRRGRADAAGRSRSCRSLTDLPLCIDSSVIEALEAGLVARTRARRSSTPSPGEDERLEAILRSWRSTARP